MARGVQHNAADHPTAVIFLDESGAIASDRFFSVGCVKIAEPSVLTRRLEKWRDQRHWYTEIHFTDLTKKALPLYKEVVDIVAASKAEFACFVADRDKADPVARFGSPWRAYEKLAEQLLVGNISPREIVTILADAYSTPDDVFFEDDLKAEVNRRLGGLAVASVVRLDSRASLPLQVVDLLTTAVTFEFRQAAGLASKRSPKARLANHVRGRYGVDSVLSGARVPRMNVAVYAGGRGEAVTVRRLPRVPPPGPDGPRAPSRERA